MEVVGGGGLAQVVMLGVRVVGGGIVSGGNVCEGPYDFVGR